MTRCRAVAVLLLALTSCSVEAEVTAMPEPAAEVDESLSSPGAPTPTLPGVDELVGLMPIAARGDAVDAFIASEFPERVPHPGTGLHVATVRTVEGTADLYVWEATTTLFDEEKESMCSALLSNDGNGESGCSSPIRSEPGAALSESRGSIGIHQASAQLVNAPPDADWFVVELDTGYTLATEVVEGHSYIEWKLELGEQVRISALDADLAEVWVR